jgi:dihydroorotate dehydrogenase
MYPLFRRFLFSLNPEAAHQLTLNALSLAGNIPLSRWFLTQLFRTPSKPVQAFGLTFKNPLGIAAGYDKDAIAINGLSAMGFGHVEVGTVTPRPQPGNPRPRVFRLLEDEGVINRLGFPSRGSEFVQMQLNPTLRTSWFERAFGIQTHGEKYKKLAVRKGDVVLGVNIGKNKETPNESAVLDYLELLQNFAPYADYIAINISSPNTVGLRQLQGREALNGLLTQLHAQRQLEEKKLEKKLPLLVKLAPDLTESELDDAIGVILDTGMDGVIATNTTLSREGVKSMHQGESGGLSGSPLTVKSEAVLSRVVKLVNGKVPIISVGGIMSPEDAKKRLALGASLVQMYTGLVYRGPGLVREIIKSL